MTDLRQAAQQALDALREFGYHGSSPRWERTANALKAALGHWDIGEDNPDSLANHPTFRRAPQQQAEPVAWTNDDLDIELTHKPWMSEAWKPLYTAPPQRKPLTDEEIDQLLPEIVSGGSFTVITYGRAVARAIEAAHNIKEQP